MIQVQIRDIKLLMSHLLIQNTFDFYHIIEAKLSTFCTFSIDGVMQKEYVRAKEGEFPKEANEPGISYVSWKEVRPFCYSLIRGKQTPSEFQFVFLLPPDQVEKLRTRTCPDFNPDLISGLVLTVRYKKGKLTLLTGTSLKSFSLDRSLEKAWDGCLNTFLERLAIPYEPM